jgi:hypothetical protein
MTTIPWITQVLALAAALSGSAAAAAANVIFSDAFDAPLPGAWTVKNNSSPPGSRSWGPPLFATLVSRDGDARFAATGFDSAGDGAPVATCSDWLISPAVTLHNGDLLSFDTRAADQDTTFSAYFPDRMQVRLNASNAGTNVGITATSVGDFSRLLLDIDPAYATDAAGGAYPLAWTRFTVPISGLPGPVQGRFAFRYFVEDTSTRGSEIGVDNVVLASDPAGVPEPAAPAALGSLVAVGLLRGRRRRGSRPSPPKGATP